jgi:glycosyltransferase involved in cell wall biosynthesis
MKVSVFTGLGELSVEIVTQQLMHALKQIAGDELETAIYRPPNVLRRLFGGIRPLARFAFYVDVGLLYGLYARGKQGDVNHVMDNQYAQLVHFLDSARTVVTFHSGTPKTFHHILGMPYRIHLRYFEWATRGMLKARYIFTVSAYTSRELLDDYMADPGQIVVTYPGVTSYFRPASPAERASARRTLGIDENTWVLLHVSNSAPRKNVEVILQAIPALRQHLKEPLLFLHVGETFSAAQQEIVKELGIGQNVRAIPTIPHNALPPFYHAADLLIFPSWYEGFGIPLIEAMACGVPVVCSDYELFHEVMGDAALFFPSSDPIALAECVEKVLRSRDLHRQLVAQGIGRAADFSWEGHAAKVLARYRAIVGKE